ncbi:hypothetical protein THRCLA_22293 [Thraustotheca clavata]|uniref:Apple domain-containing protein n=1 Tax=Thraustotheca clavata TaxID=74557 RepID=A0A1V9Z6L2_9STRA|nr:hypothetical protein THRCLA_22293 [Thraustotheca clavata]
MVLERTNGVSGNATAVVQIINDANNTYMCDSNYTCSLPNACSQQFADTDFLGNDIHSISNQTLGSCCNLCSTTSGCSAYTFNSGVCYLKKFGLNAFTSTGSIAGLTSSTCQTAYMNTVFTGNDLTSLSSQSVAECSQACSIMASCVGFGYDSASQTCYFKSSLVQASSDSVIKTIVLNPLCSIAETLSIPFADGEDEKTLKFTIGNNIEIINPYNLTLNLTSAVSGATIGSLNKLVVNVTHDGGVLSWNSTEPAIEGSLVNLTLLRNGANALAVNATISLVSSANYIFTCDSSTSTCAVPPQCSVQYSGINFPGNDLTEIITESAADCCAQCTAYDGCQAYSFETSTSSCYLKSIAANTGWSSDVISGISASQCITMLPNTDFPNYDIGEEPGFTAAQCEQMCNSDSTCAGYRYVPATMECWPKYFVNNGVSTVDGGYFVLKKLPCLNPSIITITIPAHAMVASFMISLPQDQVYTSPYSLTLSMVSATNQATTADSLILPVLDNGISGHFYFTTTSFVVLSNASSIPIPITRAFGSLGSVAVTVISSPSVLFAQGYFNSGITFADEQLNGVLWMTINPSATLLPPQAISLTISGASNNAWIVSPKQCVVTVYDTRLSWPNAPSNLRQINATGSSVAVAWDPPAFTGGLGVTILSYFDMAIYQQPQFHL